MRIRSFQISFDLLALSIVLLCVLALSSCSVTQPVRVLDEGATRATLSVGGPIVRLGGVTVPVPYLNVGVMHGYTSDVTLTGNIHGTMAMLKDLALDVGAATRVVHQEGWVPEVTAKGQLYLFSDLEMIKNARVFPMVGLNASRLIGESTLLYAGVDQLIQFNNPHYFVTPFVGAELPLSERWAMQTEVKWMAANIESAHGALRGVGSVGGHGSAAIFFGFTWRIPR